MYYLTSKTQLFDKQYPSSPFFSRVIKHIEMYWVCGLNTFKKTEDQQTHTRLARGPNMFLSKPRAESIKLQKERGGKTWKGCSHLIPLQYCSAWLLQSISALSAVTSQSPHQHQHRLYSTAFSAEASYIHLKNLQDCLISSPPQYGGIIIRKSEQDPSHFFAFMLLVFLKESHNPSLGFY